MGGVADSESRAVGGLPAERGSVAARRRADPLLATAPPARRLLLIEVPGPWGRAGLAGSRLDPQVTRPLAEAADEAGVRVQLIRRPGRHAGPRRPGAIAGAGRHAWALACPDDAVVRWGHWTDERDLLGIDLTERLDRAVHSASGPQRLALVCTHAKHDVCCAVRGRPVAAAVAAGTDRQTWETSHLGGDRFAANLLLLPEGEVFGSLDEGSAPDAAARLDGGRLTLPHYRGRVGRPPVQQAAVHLAAAALDDDRLGAVRIRSVRALAEGGPDGDRWEVLVDHEPEPVGGRRRAYRLVLAGWWSEPDLLSCTAVAAKPARRYDLLAMDPETIDDPQQSDVIRHSEGMVAWPSG